MSTPDPPYPTPALRLRRFLRGLGFSLILLITMAGAVVLMAAPIFPSPNEALNLQVGDVVPTDVLAPRPISYASQVLTEQAREAAASSVPDVFDPPDARIGRRQVQKLRAALEFIDTVRADMYATPEQQQADVSALAEVSLQPEIIADVLAFSDQDWGAVKQEAVRVLDEVMRPQVREDRLVEARRTMPSLVTIALNETQVGAVIALVDNFILPNSLFNETETNAARQTAREAVEPVTQTFATGQTIAARGQVLTEPDYEAMQQLGLIQPEQNGLGFLSTGLAVVACSAVLVLFVVRYHPQKAASLRYVILFCFLLLLMLLSARLMVPGNVVMPFLFPAATLAIILTVIFGPHLALTTAVLLGALVGYLGGNSLELAAYAAFGGVLAALALGRARRASSYLRSGLAVALGNMAIILIFRLPEGTTDTLGMATLLGASLFNGLSAMFSLPLLFVLGLLFDITTSLQLNELSRPNHPLLQFILRNAPGTYQHSLQVANLAEHAAERIGGNPLLAHVGALYHDCGKALHPLYFVENQIAGDNIHEGLDPKTSASIIIDHVNHGLTLARKYRLPTRIRDFIPEHHGTLCTMYQYSQALEDAGGDESRVNPADFTYPGPRPQSREAALLMLADACESAVRANRPGSVEELDRLIKGIIDDRLARGQLDDTNLTINDLSLIRESFVGTLKGTSHARIKYPGDKKDPSTTTTKPASARD